MSAVIDVAEQAVHGRIEIEAPSAAVFRALTEPSELAMWWGSAETYRTSEWKLDLRVGGEWSCIAKDVTTGEVSRLYGAFVTITPPRVLEYTWHASWEDFRPSTIRYELEATAKGTLLRVTHSGFADRRLDRDGYVHGWPVVLGWLEGFFTRSPAAT